MNTHTILHLLLLSGLSTATQPLSCDKNAVQFSLKYIRTCLKPEFIHKIPIPMKSWGSEITCLFVCISRGPRCQGFRLTSDGVCQTFEFDRCSHMTNVADCTSFDWAYVRKHENLPIGQLCPLGYGNGYHGSTYKVINVNSWSEGLALCSSEPGLTKYADAMDRPENDHLHWIKNNVNSGKHIYIGGHRIGDFHTGTWFWLACNVAFLPEMWESGQPNCPSCSKANVWSGHARGIDDEIDSHPSIHQGLCECINPFV